MATGIALYDRLRNVGFASISANYVAFGSAFTHSVRAICITNATAGDLFIAFTNGGTPLSDGTQDNWFLPAGSFRLYDVAANNIEDFKLSNQTQVWVRQSTAPVSKAVYLELMYGKGE